MGLSPSTCAKLTVHTYGTHAHFALDDLTSHLVHLALVYGQFSHLCGKILKIYNLNFYFSTLLLDLLGTTSQRKLAHIQRRILLICHFNSITDIPVGTSLLSICDQSVLPVSK